MCTIVWRNGPEGLYLAMNRDELKGRAPERPPSIETPAESPAWIAPRDGARGGAWIGVNAAGAALCLTNGPMPLEEAQALHARNPPSRGAIIPACLPLGGYSEILAHIRGRFDPAPYPPFTLVLASPSASEARAFAWTRFGEWEETAYSAGWRMHTASLWHTAEVHAWRMRAFEAWRGEGAPFEGPFPAYSLHQPPGEESHAPLMERPYASTRSITAVAVAPAFRAATPETRGPDSGPEFEPGVCLLRHAPVIDSRLQPPSTHRLPLAP